MRPSRTPYAIRDKGDTQVETVRLSEMRFASIAVRALAAVVSLAAMLVAVPGFAQPRQTLGEGDTVRVTVFQQPDLTTEARISERGTIVFPLIGEVEVNGLTPTEAGARIAQRLRNGGFLVSPQVNVSISQAYGTQVAVLGQVTRPGKYALAEAAPRLTDALALAGGITPTGNDVVTVLTKRGSPEKREIDVAAIARGDTATNIELHNGDTIFVERAPMFYIHGQVQRAGTYRLEPGMNVMQAVSVGGGTTLRGTLRGLKIHRRTAAGQVVTIDAQLTDQVRADDVIYVRESLF